MLKDCTTTGRFLRRTVRNDTLCTPLSALRYQLSAPWHTPCNTSDNMVIDPNIRLSTPTDAQLLRNGALRKQAEKFVAQAFFTPMFKAMRSSPFKSEILSGGRGGEVFQSMFDGVLAERMGRGSGKSLVDAMVDRLDPETSRLLKRLTARGFAPALSPSMNSGRGLEGGSTAYGAPQAVPSPSHPLAVPGGVSSEQFNLRG